MKFRYLILGIGIFMAAYYVQEVVQWLPYRNQIDYGEGLIMYINKMWAAGTWKWDLNIPPYIPLMYGAGMPLVSWPLIKLFGDGLWVGRIIMVASNIAICLFLYLIATKLTGKKIYGLIAALLPLAHPVIRDWSLQCRVDMLAAAFDVAGLYLFIRFKDTHKVYWSILPFLCAFNTRITSITTAIAVCAWLLIYNRRLLWKYTSVLVISAGVIFITLNVATHGGYWWNVVKVNFTDPQFFDWVKSIANLGAVFLPLSVFLILILIFLPDCWRNREINLILIFVAVALVVDTVTELKPAGFINYFIEFIYAVCLCFVVMLPKIEDRATKWIKKNAFITGMILIVLMIVAAEHAFPFPNKQYSKDMAVAETIISDTDKPVITEHFAAVLNADKEIYAEYFILTNWTKVGLWDQSNYLSDYQNQKFDYIILRTPVEKRLEGDGHFTKEIMAVISKNYTAIYNSENGYWYGIHIYESNTKLAKESECLTSY